MLRFLRRLVLLVLIATIFALLAYLINTEDQERRAEVYSVRLTDSVSTAISAALFAATRTAEADLPQYRLIVIAPGQALDEIAESYGTTVEVLRMANALQPDVEFGNGEELIVPEGVLFFDPPRRLNKHVAVAGDTLESLARFYAVTVELLALDNPVLAARGVNPGDTVFIPIVLTF